ncbi:MAG: anaerobic ribonucleoside-triphosphate reductase activating protein [Candidatus Magasanikbacteria bacterium]|nr:anaerobic ribonucleoside-triphosphate reductase activating protein [Candidatus Magasanikbacteria bacterium]
MIDFPEKIACIIFTAGCNFRCGYCHNPEFVLPERIKKIKKSFIPIEAAYNFLKKRKGLLDGVVISGGEPTVLYDLPEFIEGIKKMGFLVKLDTNGNNPSMLKQLIEKELIDYVAMDVKTSEGHYKKLVGEKVKRAYIKESINIIKTSNIPYEFRSTIIKQVHTKKILKNMAHLVSGAKKYVLQEFRPGETLDPVYGEYTGFSRKEMEDIAKDIFIPIVENVSIRSQK